MTTIADWCDPSRRLAVPPVIAITSVAGVEKCGCGVNATLLGR
jgi:hypothetical protein